MIQPKDIEEYFKDKKIFDHLGWTGEYHVSAKDVVDCYIDLLNKIQSDEDKIYVGHGIWMNKEAIETFISKKIR